MRFRIRFEHGWLENLLPIAALASLPLLVLALALDSHSRQRWLSEFPIVYALVVAASYWPGFCEVDGNGLRLRRRLVKKTLVPYNSLVELRARTDGYGVFAVTNDGTRLTIPVSQTPEFLREAYRRCPRLNPLA